MPFIWNVQKGKSVETENRLGLPRAGGLGKKMGRAINGYGISFWGNESVLKSTVVMVVNSMDVLKTTEL